MQGLGPLFTWRGCLFCRPTPFLRFNRLFTRRFPFAGSPGPTTSPAEEFFKAFHFGLFGRPLIRLGLLLCRFFLFHSLEAGAFILFPDFAADRIFVRAVGLFLPS